MNVAGLALAGGVVAGLGMTIAGDRLADEIHDHKGPMLSGYAGIGALGLGVGAAKVGLDAARGAGPIGMIIGGAALAGLGAGLLNGAYLESLERQG